MRTVPRDRCVIHQGLASPSPAADSGCEVFCQGFSRSFLETERYFSPPSEVTREIELRLRPFQMEKYPELLMAIHNCKNENLKRWVRERKECQEKIRLERKLLEGRRVLVQYEARLTRIKENVSRVEKLLERESENRMRRNKEKLCEEHGIEMCVIPDNISDQEIESFILRCQRMLQGMSGDCMETILENICPGLRPVASLVRCKTTTDFKINDGGD